MLGRIDYLMIVRGVNVSPSAVDAIVRAFPLAEYRIVRPIGLVEEIEFEIEAPREVAPALAESFREHLGPSD